MGGRLGQSALGRYWDSIPLSRFTHFHWLKIQGVTFSSNFNTAVSRMFSLSPRPSLTSPSFAGLVHLCSLIMSSLVYWIDCLHLSCVASVSWIAPSLWLCVWIWLYIWCIGTLWGTCVLTFHHQRDQTTASQNMHKWSLEYKELWLSHHLVYTGPHLPILLKVLNLVWGILLLSVVLVNCWSARHPNGLRRQFPIDSKFQPVSVSKLDVKEIHEN